MTRFRALLSLTLVAGLGLALAQGMMGNPNDARYPGSGYGTMPPEYRGYGGYGMGGHGTMHPGHGPGGNGMGMMGGSMGMMGGGMGMMGGSMGGMGMMGGSMMRVLPPDAQPLGDDVLLERLEAAGRAFAPSVTVADVMPFADHTYAQFIDADGTGLAEVLVDRYSGVVTPEPGPNMMWNRRSGMAGSGMVYGHGYGTTSWGTAPDAVEDRYDVAGARELATAFLADYLPGAEVLIAQVFPGYATFDYGRDGRFEGMLSVHLETGQIWPHTWHGVYRADADDHDE
ncbi:MAG: hypothetical protein R6W77_03875 [Trueperaceae bacterium]